MQKIVRFEFLMSPLELLSAKSLHVGEYASIFLVSRSGLFDLIANNRNERCWAIVGELYGSTKSSFLWAANSEEVEQVIGPPEVSLSQRAIWRIRQQGSLDLILQDEATSGWALLFFDEDAPKLKAIPESFPTASGNLEMLAAALSASAIVVSLYDDTEWLIAIRND